MSQPPTEYATELKYDDPRDDYLKIPLPKEIEKFDVLEENLKTVHRIHRKDLNAKEVGKDNALFPKLVKTKEIEAPNYIRIGFERQGRHTLVIKTKESNDHIPDKDKKSRYINKDWLTENLNYYMRIPEDFRNLKESPLHGSEKGSSATLEVDQENTEMRIYSPEGYRYRSKELEEKDRRPVRKKLTFTGLSLNLVDGYIDPMEVAGSRQKFRIIPFDITHEIFTPDLDGLKLEKYSPDPDYLKKIIERGQLPRCQSPELKIYWDPNGQGDLNAQQQKMVYKETNVRDTQVILPKEGTFKVVTETEEGRKVANINHGSGFGGKPSRTEIGDWEGMFLEKNPDEQHITVYVPCQTTSQSSNLLSKLREYFSM